MMEWKNACSSRELEPIYEPPFWLQTDKIKWQVWLEKGVKVTVKKASGKDPSPDSIHPIADGTTNEGHNTSHVISIRWLHRPSIPNISALIQVAVLASRASQQFLVNPEPQADDSGAVNQQRDRQIRPLFFSTSFSLLPYDSGVKNVLFVHISLVHLLVSAFMFAMQAKFKFLSLRYFPCSIVCTRISFLVPLLLLRLSASRSSLMNTRFSLTGLTRTPFPCAESPTRNLIGCHLI